MIIKHEPVLVEEFLQAFENLEIDTFFDGTLGLGGHAEALLKSHKEIKVYIACDQEFQAIKIAQEKLKKYENKIRYKKGNFAGLDRYLEEEDIGSVDGVFFDVGVSSMQIDMPDRGFSFGKTGPLDMRMDRENELTAAEVVNKFSEKKLGEIFKDMGEEPRWRQVAKQIVSKRREKKITTTKELLEVISPVLKRRGRIHPATLVFQALRIYVNSELEMLEKGIKRAVTRLKQGGIIGVISFHSLEDRIVKNLFRDYAREEKKLRLITKKPITPQRKEILKNPRSRSAKMRFAMKL